MYTVCKIGKTFYKKNSVERAEAERCMERAQAGCDTEMGSCQAIINCIVAQATKEAGALAQPCSLAVINGIHLISKFSVAPGLGYATIPNQVACLNEQALLCAQKAG